MKKNKVINTFEFNLFRLKTYINANYIGDFKNKILQQMFNGIINNYPDLSWKQIEKDFFIKIPKEDIESIIIYIIISYNLGTIFTKCNTNFIQDLISTLCYYNISPTKIVEYAEIFCSSPLLEIITDAQTNHLIKPRHLFKITLDSCNLEILNQKDKDTLIKKLNRFIEESYKPIFDGNYSFFNVYTTLKNLISLKYYEIDTFALDVIPLLNWIPNEEIKHDIMNLFAQIDNSHLSIVDKIKECLNVARTYGYEIPINEKSLK